MAALALALSLFFPWAFGYGPGAPGVFFPVQRPILFGQLDGAYAIGAAIILAVLSAYRGGLAALWLRVGAFALAFGTWVYVAAFVLDPGALGGTPLPGSGFTPALSFHLVAVGCLLLAVSILTEIVPPRFDRARN